MKNVCIITLGNTYLVPYLSSYTKHIDYPYSLIYWDREGIYEEQETNTYYRLPYRFETQNKFAKLKGYVQFRKFAKTILSENDYDVVIILQTLGALLLSDVLLRKYEQKYVVDIRDYTYEGYSLIYQLEKKLVKNSLLSVVSSKGYLSFLPKHDYVVAHNIRELPKQKVIEIKSRKRNREQLHIAFIGYVNYQEQQKKLIMALKDDSRFRLSFIGTRSEELEDFCRDNDVKNVHLIGKFDSNHMLDFYQDVDFINNLYGNHTPTLDYALSNKLYLAAELSIPILVCPETYMSTVIEKFKIGTTVNLNDENIGDYLNEYYKKINWDIFDYNCNRFLDIAHAEQNFFEGKLQKILS